MLVLAILYISNKYKFFNEIFYSILQITLLIVSIDLLLEVANINRISYIFFNDLKIGNISDRFSGLFGEEKKIGSFLVRLLPLFCGLYFFNNYKKNYQIYLFFISLLIVSLAISVCGERSALISLIILFFLFSIYNNLNRKIYYTFLGIDNYFILIIYLL